MLKRFRWQLLIVFLALVTIGILLSGQQPVAVQIFEPEPVVGGIYTEGLIGSFSRLNPLLDTYNPADQDVDRLIYSSLIRYDDRGIPQAEVAESWGISKDATVYNFSLRKDALWHDGEPVTSEDILLTIEFMRSQDLPVPDDIRVMWESIEVVVLDDYTIQFRLPEPFAPFLDYLTFGILPAHYFEGATAVELIDHPFNLSPVGCGPYRFNRFIVNDDEIEGVSLVAFDDYFGDRAYIDEINFRYYPDDIQALEAYRQGVVQGISKISRETLDEAFKEESLNLYSSRLPELMILFFNLDNPQTPFFQEADIRRALLMGMHRQGIIDRVLDGQAVIADGPVFPNTWAYFEGISRVEYDPDQAEKIIREAGYTIPAEGGNIRENEDISFRFTLVHPDREPYNRIAEIVQENWAALGIGVTLVAVPYDTLINDYLETRLYEAALVDINFSRSPDPDPYPFWHQTQANNGQNYAMWNDRQASEYLEQARIIVDPAERTRLYRNFQVRFSNELPALPLFYPIYTFGVSSEVEGIRIGPLLEPGDRFSRITEWYLFSERVVTE